MGENDSMLTMFVLENGQLLEQLEELLLGGEKNEKDVYKRQCWCWASFCGMTK